MKHGSYREENPSMVLPDFQNPIAPHLKPSHTMEATGNVFDPAYYIIETSTRGGLQKRSTFETGSWTARGTAFRDRRTLLVEIRELCAKAGLKFCGQDTLGWEWEGGPSTAQRRFFAGCARKFGHTEIQAAYFS